MIASAPGRPALLRTTRRFFRTPKGLLLVVLGAVATIAVAGQGTSDALPPLAGAVAAAATVDLLVVRLSRQRWIFPDGAIISGLIIGLILGTQEPRIVPIATAILAITTKHLWRTRLANVFNPAGLALVLAGALFGSAQSWWGALPDFGWPGALFIIFCGWFIADRVNKLPLVLTFLGAYFSLFAMASFMGDPGRVAEIFRAPDVHAALFFAFFMADDPPTCPVRFEHQAAFGLAVAAASFLFFEAFGWLYFLPAGLLVGNFLEAIRRSLPRRQPRLVAA